MKKTNLFTASLLLSVLLFSSVSFSMDGQTVCVDPVKETDQMVICHNSAYSVMSRSNNWTSVSRVPFFLEEYLSFGVPDDSTNVIYSYLNRINSVSGSLLGYSQVMGLTNSEASWSARLTVYYSRKGKVLAAKLRYN